MIGRKHDLEVKHFRGDYMKMKHFVRTKRFDYAAEPLLTGWDNQIKQDHIAATSKRLAATWNQKSKLMKESGYTTEDVVDDVLADVEEWLRGLHYSGKIKKIGDR